MTDLSGNLGEWSEVYALLDVLVNREIRGTSPISGAIDFFHYEVPDARRTVGDKEAVITHTLSSSVSNSLSHDEMPYAELTTIRDSVRAAMMAHDKKKSPKKGALTIPAATPFTKFLGISTLKAGSDKKTDIELGIRDPTSNMVVVSKFSIKSLVGDSPTLLNASQATNFVYDVHGIDRDQIEALNAIVDKGIWLKLRLRKLQEMGGSLKYNTVWNRRHETSATSPFHENLRMIDSHMPEIMGEALLQWKLHGVTRLEDVAQCLVVPLAKNHGLTLTKSQIRFKLACLLEASALGMKPDKVWDGEYEVSDGILVVEENFSTRLIRTRTHDEFREGLMVATSFEGASGHKHKFGDFYLESGQVKIKLGLQIRLDSLGSDQPDQP